jgi:hypothetical protein
MATKTKRTETGALDAAWLNEALKNPNVQISDVETGQKIESEKDLKDLLAEEKLAKTAAEKKAEQKETEAADLTNNPPGDKEQEAQQKQAISDAEKAQQKQESNQKQAQLDVARRNKAAMSSTQRLINRANTATAPILQRAGGVVDQVSASRTPGGIGFLVIILIFLVFVVVVVNQKGDTRIKQLWYLMLGRATLTGRVTPDISTNTSSSSSSSSSGTTGSNPLVPVIPGTTIPLLPATGLTYTNTYRGTFSGGGGLV